MFGGETLLSGASSKCSECGKHVELQVCRSYAGFYIGTMCNCGPYSRESDYFESRSAAEGALERWNLGDFAGART